MFITSMVLEGFKSYGKRQEICGFDREFNAITGLNGSGKSNILDAICFVLGISNLTQVRAGSLQELVYKNGQAGISKASVTITFDNRDRSSSPLGYEQYEEITVTRQVVVGGKNKYLINGTNVQNKRVQDLFCSVQLNVNNPHFLIMQGRITKVLNMKPLEILSMIEEAAGTRMYESKKQQAQTTIVKKDAKLRELNEVINEEIAPKIQKLKDEQVQYMEYQKITRDLERLTKLYVAWKYVSRLRLVEEAKAKVDELGQAIQEKKTAIEDGEREVDDINIRVEQLTAKRDTESCSQLKVLEASLKDKERSNAQMQAHLKGVQEGVVSQQKGARHLEKALAEDRASLAAKQAELSSAAATFGSLKDTEEADQRALEAAQQKLTAVRSGLLSNEYGEAASLQDQLIAVKQEVARTQTAMKQAQMELEHNRKELKVKAKKMEQTESDYVKDKQVLDAIEDEVKQMEANVDRLGYEEGRVEELQGRKKQLVNDMAILQDKVDRFEARYPQVRFHYKDPEAGFNRSRVHGVVCSLHKLKDPKMAAALQVAAGSKLFNVIVDTEVTSKLLIERGSLQYRTTMIPLNRIIASRLDPRTIRLAQDLVGRENITPAMSLIEFAEEHRTAMEYVYGPTFICSDMNVAKRVAFDRNILKKCITYDGDVVDPQGTLSGGAPERGVPIMQVVEELEGEKAKLVAKEDELRQVTQDLTRLTSVAREYSLLKQRLDSKRFEMDLVRKRLQQTEHYQYRSEVDGLTTAIGELEVKVRECRETLATADPKVAKLEDKVKNAKAIREAEMKSAEADVDRLTKKAEDSLNKWKQKEQIFECLTLEIKDLEGAVEAQQKQLEETHELIAQQQEEHARLKVEAEASEAGVKQARKDMKQLKEEIHKQDRDIQQAVARKDEICRRRHDLELDLRNLGYEVTKWEEEARNCETGVTHLEGKYPWIETEKGYFGLPRGAYDFEGVDMAHTERTLANLEEQKDVLGRKLNLRALNMLGKEEEQYNELLNKKRTVENDKTKLQAVIHELDEKKKVAVRKAWQQVDRDFASIFASLLPGALARLSPPPGEDVLAGLEVKVGFGDTWKESLGELSGGQRSLVALSLILAMLLFKPAPIYILDEVDAALDLSHTQNIGNMLKKHFKHSQFIVVSLKDGMFNNANVLFRTQFVDGMSTVRRSVLRS